MTDPFAPPPLPPPDAPASKMRSVLGIVAIVFASLETLATLFDLLTMRMRTAAASSFPAGPDPETEAYLRAMREMLVSTVPIEIARAGIMVVMSIALLAVGIGLVRGSELARKLGIVWAGLALVVIAVRVWLWEAFLVPKIAAVTAALEHLMASTHAGGPGVPNFTGIFGGLARG